MVVVCGERRARGSWVLVGHVAVGNLGERERGGKRERELAGRDRLRAMHTWVQMAVARSTVPANLTGSLNAPPLPRISTESARSTRKKDKDSRHDQKIEVFLVFVLFCVGRV